MKYGADAIVTKSWLEIKQLWMFIGSIEYNQYYIRMLQCSILSMIAQHFTAKY